jgi:hypothetical protein
MTILGERAKLQELKISSGFEISRMNKPSPEPDKSAISSCYFFRFSRIGNIENLKANFIV